MLTDPVFTVKGVIGMLAEMRDHPERFAGRRVLFLHTGEPPGGWGAGGGSGTTCLQLSPSLHSPGGLFTLYDGRIDELLKQTPATNQVSVYKSS